MYVLFKENNYQKYINGYHNVYDTPREVRLHIRTQFIFLCFLIMDSIQLSGKYIVLFLLKKVEGITWLHALIDVFLKKISMHINMV